MTSDSPILAAGGIVRRIDPDGTPRVLVIHRDRYDDWCLPKGKQDPGETLKETAIREVGEEAGVAVRAERKLPSISYTVNGRPKTVTYWLMAWVDDVPDIKDDEADDVRWCTVAEAEALLTYDRERPLLAAIEPTTRPGRIWVIRHAKAGSRTRFVGNDVERPLTEAGRRQAGHLAALLANEPIASLAASPYRRCLETLAPLAAALDVAVVLDNGLAEGQPVSAIYRWCSQPEPLALCTHGDLLEELLWDLARAGIIDPGETELIAKASTWRLDTVGGQVTAASYAPPPKP